VVKQYEKNDIQQLLDIQIALESLTSHMIINHGEGTPDHMKEIVTVEKVYLKSIEGNNNINTFRYDSLSYPTVVKFVDNGGLISIKKYDYTK